MVQELVSSAAEVSWGSGDGEDDGAAAANVARSEEVADAADGSQRSEFVAITIPEAMGVLETERLLAALGELHVPCHQLVVNMVMPPTACAFCRSKRAEQQGYIANLRQQYAAYAVSELPLFPHDVRGVEGLREVGEIAFSRRIL